MIYKKLSKDEIEFLRESNYIEREYSKEALGDAVKTWNYAIENKEQFTLDYILEIHKILMSRLNPKIAGKLRNCAVYIGGCRKEKPKDGELESKINEWIDKYKVKIGSITYTDIKNLHIAFENIHPFEDGNGRVGRILMNIQMLNSCLPLIIIHEGREQGEYYGWFRK